MTFIMTTNKPLKWTTQRINNTPKIQKKLCITNNNNNNNTRIPSNSPVNEMVEEEEDIGKLEKELEFTYDSIATITVHFQSLYEAYKSSKIELKKTATRLCEMEKELLIAYDDLGLQVNQLERKISQLEAKINKLKGLSENSPYQSDASSIYSSSDSSINLAYPMYSTSNSSINMACSLYSTSSCNVNIPESFQYYEQPQLFYDQAQYNEQLLNQYYYTF